jgi:small subunit ribosomal protein S21
MKLNGLMIKDLIESIMLQIKVKDGKIEKALKQLKRKTQQVGQIQEIRKRQQFEKPSVTRRQELLKAKYVQKLRDDED